MLTRLTDEENSKLATSKFGKKAYGFWKRFGMFENNPPYAWRIDDQIVAICHITSSQRTKYCNLYYIEALVPHKGYGQALYDMIVINMMMNGIQRIKLSSEPEAISFWFDKNYFWFWSYDKYGSLKADAPLTSRKEMKILREFLFDGIESTGVNFFGVVPPDTKHLELPTEISKKNLEKALASIERVKPYYFYDLLKKSDITEWM